MKTNTVSTGTPVIAETATSTLSGIVKISKRTVEPFVTAIELRGKDTFWLHQAVTSDADGRFEIRTIPPGEYELWVLITTAAKMVSGCEDLWILDDQWRIGIRFQENDPIIMDETSLQKAISRSLNFTAYGLQPTSFYAVSPAFTVVSAFDADIEIILLCQ